MLRTGALSALVAMAIPCFSAHAVSLQDWQQRAIGVITQFEGSDYEKITTDFDCQGLTIGKGQWTFERNSVKALFDEVARSIGEPKLAALLESLEGQGGGGPPNGKPLTAAISAARRGQTPEALRIVRSWQQQKRGEEWTGLVDGECERGHTRPSEVRLIPDSAPVNRLRLFLRHPAVVAAQETLLNNSADLALERATCWAKVVRGAWRPHFSEFLFFYDYITQNGTRWIIDSELFDMVSQLETEKDKPAREDRYMLAKMQQIKDWLMADFPYIRSSLPPRAQTHAAFAASNAKTWFDLYQNGKLDKHQVKLLYVGLLRAMLGNNVFAYVAMNRRGTVVTGQGIVNNITHDFTELYGQTGEIDQSELNKMRSRMSAKNTRQAADFKAGRSTRTDVCRPS
jgi:hypothetical protein